MIPEKHDLSLFAGILFLIIGIAYSGFVVPKESISMFSFGFSAALFMLWIYNNFLGKKEIKTGG